MGDGYLFKSRAGYLVGLDVRSETFAKSFSSKLSAVLRRTVRAHYYEGGDVWFVRVTNYELYSLVLAVRRDPGLLAVADLSNKGISEFLLGFFEAEGCIKVVKEAARKTAKICIDITNTNRDLLDVVNALIDRRLGFTGRYSVQEDHRENRKTTFHLRIYKKEHVRLFLGVVRTAKLTPEKKSLLDKWLSGEPPSLRPMVFANPSRCRRGRFGQQSFIRVAPVDPQGCSSR